MLSNKTRIKLTIGLLAMIFIQSILKHFLPGLPFTEAAGFEVVIGGWYLQKKSQENEVKIAKASNGCGSGYSGVTAGFSDTESLPPR